MYQYRAPNGRLIVGTSEELQGYAYLDSWYVTEDGTVEPEYSGETEVFWENQITIGLGVDRHLVDEDRNEWLESQCRLVEVSEGTEED